MSGRLESHLTSRYIASANALRPRSARRKIVAYVESYDDVAFWRGVLSEFEDEGHFFEVMLPSRDTLGKGKKAALMNRLGPSLGEFMIACVDADYDWLMQGATEASRMLCGNPYVMHTYAYAIENYQCYAPALHEACVMSTLNDRQVVDLEGFMEEYSRAVWPLLVWSVWAYRNGRFKEFSLSDFASAVSFHDINPSNTAAALAALRRRVNKCVAWLQRKFPEARKGYAPLRDELLALGLEPAQAYLYMQGHTLMDGVALPLLAPVCNILRREREREISQLALHATQKQNELASYQHSQSPVDVMLRKGTGFRGSPPYQLLRADLRRLMEEVGRQK